MTEEPLPKKVSVFMRFNIKARPIHPVCSGAKAGLFIDALAFSSSRFASVNPT